MHAYTHVRTHWLIGFTFVVQSIIYDVIVLVTCAMAGMRVVVTCPHVH